MTRPLMRAVAACVLLAGCSYDPPLRADHASAAYRADLDSCQDSGAKEADRRMKARGYLFLTWPASYPFVLRGAVRDCMHGKGYADASG